MMMLWIVCLLIGSITCGPVRKGYGSHSGSTFMQQPFSSGSWYSGTGGSSDLGSSSSLPSLSYPSFNPAAGLPAPRDTVSSAGPVSYSSTPVIYSSNANIAGGEAFDSGYTGFSPAVGEYGAAYEASTWYDGSAPGGSYGGSYGSSASAYAGDGSYGFVLAPQDESLSSGSAAGYGAGDENPEPVLSDLSDLEPVYSFSSRSRYQHGRSVFAETSYTPGEPVQVMPVSNRISGASRQRSPAKPLPKGGF
ncbi:RNA-binding protein FUS-like [Chaetodon trifascialis]|uniref:RNA-binding protein FUS-like n=1 Tax=Chaetodon trifascialis TaxID=109706 RepID=UPI003996A814